MQTTPLSAADIAQLLADQALAVCQHYLPAGRREGRYWQVGNVHGEPGRSLYVRLYGDGRGKAGNWVDAATGERGDLLDLIRAAMDMETLGAAMAEAQRFLGAPRPLVDRNVSAFQYNLKDHSSIQYAQRLFQACMPLSGSLAGRYLLSRGITRLDGLSAIRFHPRLPYRSSLEGRPARTSCHPAMICSVTDKGGQMTGIHRTWLNALGTGKANVADPRKSLGAIAGNGIRVGACGGVLAAGEGLETMLSLREALPGIPIVAATSASHLSALILPSGMQRLYVARERDAAGDAAWTRLCERAGSVRIVPLVPRRKDFNDDLMAEGRVNLADHLRGQLLAADRDRFSEA